MVGPLATTREPHSYDLCDAHARRLTVPHGWELVRHQGDYTAPMPTDDDLVALANAVREAASGERIEPEPPAPDTPPRHGYRGAAAPHVSARRHLRVVSGDEDVQR
ncbi:hypothetical protein GCM10027447_02960 [Glycomyces halotolerans]